MDRGRITVTLIGGYLGAGKTTVLNHMLRSLDEPVAVLVNDFGSLSIDEALIESRADDVMSLANGCICCSLTDGFVTALDRLRALEPRPGRLVIETSGVGDLEQVASYAGLPGLRLDGIVCVADAEMVKRRTRDRFVGDLVRSQIEAADLLVLNKTDLVDSPRLQQARELLMALAPRAAIVEAVHGAVPLPVLLGTMPRDVSQVRGPGHLHDDAEDLFVSWTWEATTPVPADDLRRALAALPSAVVRAKGIVRTVERPDEATVVQVVGRRHELSVAGPRTASTSRIVFIALRDDLGSTELPELFAPSSPLS